MTCYIYYSVVYVGYNTPWAANTPYTACGAGPSPGDANPVVIGP